MLPTRSGEHRSTGLARGGASAARRGPCPISLVGAKPGPTGKEGEEEEEFGLATDRGHHTRLSFVESIVEHRRVYKLGTKSMRKPLKM